MPIQYYYPYSDYFISEDGSTYDNIVITESNERIIYDNTIQSGNGYSHIDEGVSSFNDSDYLKLFRPAQSGTAATVQFGPVDYSCLFNISNLRVESLTLNIRMRYRPVVSASAGGNDFGQSGTIRFDLSEIGHGINTGGTFGYIPSGDFIDYTYPIVYDFDSLYSSNPTAFSEPLWFELIGQVGSGASIDISAVEIFASGISKSNNPTTLFIGGYDTIETGVPLFIQGHDTSYSGCDLYLEVSRDNKSTDLFIKGNGGTISGGLGLVEWATGSSSGYSNNSTTLFIGNRNEFSGGATLFIDGPSSGFYNNGTTLFIKRDTTPSHNGLNLTLKVIESLTPVYSVNATTLFLDNHGYSSGYAPLYITAPSSGSISNAIGLEVFNNQVYTLANNSTALTVLGPQTLTAFTSLALQGVRSLTGGNTLFLSANTSGNNTTTLYINSEVGGFPTKSATLFLDAPDSLTNPSSGDMTLYTSGPLSTNDFLMNGSSPLSGVGLFIYGTPHTASTTLFIRNGYYDIDNGSMPLVIANKLNTSGQMSLHTIAGLTQGVADLVIFNSLENFASGTTPLSIFSSAHSGRFSSATMYVESAGLGTNVPLYIKTDNSANIFNTSTLYTKAGNVSTASVPMTLQSVYQSYSGVQLNVVGTGDLIGGSVANGQITLFINRPSDNVGNGIGMMINGPSGINNYVNLSISGGTLVNSNMTLVMPSSIGLINNNTSLFTHGF